MESGSAKVEINRHTLPTGVQRNGFCREKIRNRNKAREWFGWL